MIRIFNQYVSIKSLLLMLVEDVLIVLSVLLAVRLRFWNDTTEFHSYIAFPEFGLQVLVILAAFQISFYYMNLHEISIIRRQLQFLVSLGQATGAASLVLGLVYYLFPYFLIGRGVFFIALVLMVSSVVLSRVALDRAWQIPALQQNVLILGDGDLALMVARELERRGDLSCNIVGFVGETQTAAGDAEVSPVLGTPEQLEEIVRGRKVHRIIVALRDQRGRLPVRELVRIRVQGVRVEDAQSTMAALTGRVWLNTVKPSWFVFSDGFRRARLILLCKRVFDIFFSLIGFALSLPIMAVVALAIRLESKGPVIYRQARVGLGGRVFNVLKFRSMRADAEAKTGAQWARSDDPRITTVGKYIRKFRLDELPQFVNVIRGDMSFVGPRPERPVFVEMLRKEISYYDERHSVRPGLTGWAQVQYPYGASIEDAFRKLEYDLFYLKNMSLSFDIAIIFQTIRTVCTGSGAR